MKRKLKIILKVTKKAVKKAPKLVSKDFYRGGSAPHAAWRAVRYTYRNGWRAAVKHAKREMVRLGGENTVRHHFPNGLVSGVETAQIAPWYRQHGRPVTIVIPSYNDYDILRECVASIHRTCRDKSKYHIIIVDDYCQPENRENLKTLIDDNTRVIFREQNGGFAKAMNTGLKEVPKGHDVVWVNSDVTAHDGWLEALQYGAYVFDNKAGIVGPKLLYPDGRIQSAGSYRNTEAREWFDHYYRFQPENYGPANVPCQVLGMTGACLYVTARAFQKIGLIDEGCEFAFDDADYCLRAWQAGYHTLYFPAAVLTHHESASRAKNPNISDKEKRSVAYFWDKWGDWFDKRTVTTKDGRIKIIYVLQTMGWSGGIRMIVEQANHLDKSRFEVELWALDGKCVWPNEVKIRAFKDYAALSEALKDEDAIKVATWWETAYPVWQASLLRGIPVYFIQEIESWFYPDDPDAQRTVVSCYRKEFINYTTSSYNLDEIRSFGLKAELIPCAYDSNTYKQLPDVTRKDNVLLALGRTFFQKNFMQTFRAWKLLGDKRPDMWLFGIEPDMVALDRKKIKYFEKPSNERVNELYNQATVFVQTSYHEGFCLPVLEAMAAGVPVICTDSHGNRDFCHDGKNCLMVPHDDDQALADAIQKLMDSPKLRDKLRREGLKTVKDYQWKPVMRQVEAFFTSTANPEPVLPLVQKKYGGAPTKTVAGK